MQGACWCTSSTGCRAVMPDTAADCFAHGCAWPVTLELPVGPDWPSGGVPGGACGPRAPGRPTAGSPSGPRGARPSGCCSCARPRPGPPTTTGAAAATTRGSAAAGSPQLSLERPWSRATLQLPEGAPRKSHPHDLPLGWVPHYPTARVGAGPWASRSTPARPAGHPTRATSCAGPSAQGYAVDVATQHDLRQLPDLLDGYRTLVLIGHDEYWSLGDERRRRRVRRGGRRGRRGLAGNFFWQIRLEQDGRVQVCHKYTARDTDPVASEPTTATCSRRPGTTRWSGGQAAVTMGHHGDARGSTCGLAGRAQGVRRLHGVPARALAVRGRRPVLRRPVRRRASRAFAYEVDGLDYAFRHGLPYAYRRGRRRPRGRRDPGDGAREPDRGGPRPRRAACSPRTTTRAHRADARGRRRPRGRRAGAPGQRHARRSTGGARARWSTSVGGVGRTGCGCASRSSSGSRTRRCAASWARCPCPGAAGGGASAPGRAAGSAPAAPAARDRPRHRRVRLDGEGLAVVRSSSGSPPRSE